MAIKEFHDLAELQLNINPADGLVESSWGNLGYWSDSQGHATSGVSYSQACNALATKVGDMASLDAGHRVLDTGFGCGDQLLVWLQQFNVKKVIGINVSISQTQYAKEKIDAVGLPEDIFCQVLVGDVCCDKTWQGLGETFDRIIALDCIYHFTDKLNYFSQCKRKLNKDGALVITDLVLKRSSLKMRHKLLLKVICYLSHIPFENIKTISAYQDELESLGLDLVKSEDLSGKVLLPFGTWLEGYIKQINSAEVNTFKFNWLKYRGTARFLRWAHDNRVFSYHLLRIEIQN